MPFLFWLLNKAQGAEEPTALLHRNAEHPGAGPTPGAASPSRHFCISRVCLLAFFFPSLAVSFVLI